MKSIVALFVLKRLKKKRTLQNMLKRVFCFPFLIINSTMESWTRL